MSRSLDEKYLPVEGVDGLIVDAHIVTLTYMTWGNDPASANTAIETYRRELEAGGYTQVSEILANAASKKLGSLQLCGAVAIDMLMTAQDGEAPSLRKSASVVARAYARTRTRDGKAAPTSVPQLKMQVRKNQNTLHLWSAWLTLNEADHLRFLHGDRDVVALFFRWSAYFQIEFATHSLQFSEKEQWQPWSAPEVFMRDLAEARFVVERRETPEAMLRFRSEYRRSAE